MKLCSLLATLAFVGLGIVAAPARADQAFITAAVHWPNGKAQFFLSNGSYVRYDIKADRADPDYPKPVNDDNWPGLGAYGRAIIAAVNALDPNKVYFFLADGTYIRYDIMKDRVDNGYPKPVNNQTWPGLANYATRLYGALNWENDRIQFFLNDGSYIRYDLRADRVDDGYPRPITHATWPGLAPYAAHLAGAINWNNGKAYIFLDDGRYLRYDIGVDRVEAGYPKLINDKTWPGLHRYFRRRE
jgi:hypothetical protein